MNYNKARKELDAILANLMTEKKMRESDKMLIAHDDAWREKIGNTLRGKTLEELVGKERAELGRKKRAESASGSRPKEVGQKIAATRRANGSYENNGMTGKEHKESTKSIMKIKAGIRQELKRKHGLGKSDKVPPELLAKAYKKAGLI
jgi:hypothetical protein